MTFVFEKERLTARSPDGLSMGHISFPRVRPGLVRIDQVMTNPGFRGQGVAESMMEALLTHLTNQNQKAALTCPIAQQYVRKNPRWKHILPGDLHCVTH